MDADRRGDLMEKQLLSRLMKVYNDALAETIRRIKPFLVKVRQVERGEISPPAYYTQTDAVDEWEKAYVTEQIRTEDVVGKTARTLDEAGKKASDLIFDAMVDVYLLNLTASRETIQLEAAESGKTPYVAPTLTEREVRIILRDKQGPFSKIAYMNLGANPAVRRRLQEAMAREVASGKGQDAMIQSIREIAGMSFRQAKRVAQTERTRVQGEARYEAGQEAEANGIRVYNEWRCKFDNSRDAHMERHGKKALSGQVFPGSVMRFPGDPNGPAKEVINCHCIMVQHVLLQGETIDEEGNVVQGSNIQNTEISPNIELPTPRSRDMMDKNTDDAEVPGVHIIGKLDRSIYRVVSPDITTDDVIITDERIQHIRERHPNDFEMYESIMKKAIVDPDYIIHTDAPKTAFVLKEDQKDGITTRLILRLQTSTDEIGRKNSVITFQYVKEKEYRRLIRNKKILYKKDGL